MEVEKLLTIIIPAYNMEKYLERCCKSLILKDNSNLLEILIINDGSTDSTSKIAHSFQNKYSKVFRVIDKVNGNYGSCINKGLSEAKGYFIKTLDADDQFDDLNFQLYFDYLNKIKSESDCRVDLVITDMQRVNESGEKIKKISFSFPQKQICHIGPSFYDEFCKIVPHCVTYRTDLLRDMKYTQMEGISYTDQEWIRYPMLAVKNFVYYPQVLYLYTVGRIGQTMEPDILIKNIWMEFSIKKHMVDFYANNASLYSLNNKKLCEKLILSSLEKTYAQFLMLDREVLDENELIKFDSFLGENHNNFYQGLATLKFEKFPVRYIAYWRDKKNRWRYEWSYSIYNLLRRIKHIFK